jgi:crotonobetainyl-CoA:carnitine CoA-transferase CaiB-like acyl-CoA transferase
VGASELLSKPEYATPQLRSKNRKELNARLADITRERSSSYWIAALNEAGIPCGAINGIDQTFAEPQVQHLGIARPVQHPQLGEIRVVGQPINMSAAPQPPTMRPTPDLGQHTVEVLTGLGYSEAAIADLSARGVI